MIGGVRTLAISSSARSRVRMVCAIAMPTLPAPITDTLLAVQVRRRRGGFAAAGHRVEAEAQPKERRVLVDIEASV
jgi:hypothetical protein